MPQPGFLVPEHQGLMMWLNPIFTWLFGKQAKKTNPKHWTEHWSCASFPSFSPVLYQPAPPAPVLAQEKYTQLLQAEWQPRSSVVCSGVFACRWYHLGGAVTAGTVSCLLMIRDKAVSLTEHRHTWVEGTHVKTQGILCQGTQEQILLGLLPVD